jgi:hypothetical protein
MKLHYFANEKNIKPACGYKVKRGAMIIGSGNPNHTTCRNCIKTKVCQDAYHNWLML